MILTPATELDAINEIIGAVGESPIDSLENLTDVDALNAQRLLSVINRQQQARGWSFNIVESYNLNPDMKTKKILWDSSFLYLKGSNGEKYAKQGDLLKDVTNNTTTFNDSISVTVILLVPFDEMPEALRRFITAKAALAFATRYFGDETILSMLGNDVKEAWQQLQEYELDLNDYNILNNSSVQELTSR